jgi:hypothetical protein
LTKMATGEYDGSQSKSEEFKLTAEDLNGIESLEALAGFFRGHRFRGSAGAP